MNTVAFCREVGVAKTVFRQNCSSTVLYFFIDSPVFNIPASYVPYVQDFTVVLIPYRHLPDITDCSPEAQRPKTVNFPLLLDFPINNQWQ